jgi:hypothetical protein
MISFQRDTVDAAGNTVQSNLDAVFSFSNDALEIIVSQTMALSEIY